MTGFFQGTEILWQGAFVPVLELSVRIIIHNLKIQFLLIVKVYVLRRHDLKDLNSYVMVNVKPTLRSIVKSIDTLTFSSESKIFRFCLKMFLRSKKNCFLSMAGRKPVICESTDPYKVKSMVCLLR